MMPAVPPSRHRQNEELYFQQRDRELIEKLRRRAEETARLHSLSEHTGVADEAILKDLLALGYTADTLALLHLAPLVQVAWADGEVSEAERALILNVARLRGIGEQSSAGRQLLEWLSVRPSDAVFDKTMRI